VESWTADQVSTTKYEGRICEVTDNGVALVEKEKCHRGDDAAPSPTANRKLAKDHEHLRGGPGPYAPYTKPTTYLPTSCL
jgi:hypothetical protein